MFAFNRWADWLKSQDFERVGLRTAYRDTRDMPECASNPCFGMDIDAPDRLGEIRIWQVGLCDFEVLDVSTDQTLISEHGLDANDETVRGLVARFISFFGSEPASDGR